MEDTIMKTERLILRYQRKSDIKFLVYLWMDEEMTKYTGGPRDKAQLIEGFRNIAEDPKKTEYDLWPLEKKGNHELVCRPGNVLPISQKTGIMMAGEVHATRKAEART